MRRPPWIRVCPPQHRPCHHVACRYHLWTEWVYDGRAVVDLVQTRTWGDRRHTCALREAHRGGMSLEEIGQALHLTRERARQIQARALEDVRRRGGDVLRCAMECEDVCEKCGEYVGPKITG